MLPENLIYLFVGLATVYNELADDDPIFIPTEWYKDMLETTEPPKAKRSIIVPLHRSITLDSEDNPDPTAWI